MIIDVQPLTTVNEIGEMIKALEMSKLNANRNVLLFKIGVSTGLRVGDIIKLKVSDVKGNLVLRFVKVKRKRTYCTP